MRRTDPRHKIEKALPAMSDDRAREWMRDIQLDTSEGWAYALQPGLVVRAPLTDDAFKGCPRAATREEWAGKTPKRTAKEPPCGALDIARGYFKERPQARHEATLAASYLAALPHALGCGPQDGLTFRFPKKEGDPIVVERYRMTGGPSFMTEAEARLMPMRAEKEPLPEPLERARQKCLQWRTQSQQFVKQKARKVDLFDAFTALHNSITHPWHAATNVQRIRQALKTDVEAIPGLSEAFCIIEDYHC